MDALPLSIAVLAAEIAFPPPDDPDDPNSGFSLTIEEARQFDALLNALVEYIQVQYARCGKQTETP